MKTKSPTEKAPTNAGMAGGQQALLRDVRKVVGGSCRRIAAKSLKRQRLHERDLISVSSYCANQRMKNQTSYFGLPINIQDILTARTGLVWARACRCRRRRSGHRVRS